MEEKRYAEDGYLIVSELYRCPFFEKDSAVIKSCCSEDCFFCKYSDFRKMDYIRQLEESPKKGALYSICHNESNKKQ